MSGGDWDLFRMFFTVAEMGSINKAAATLGMSQPTLSRRLAELERQVGAPLVFRTPVGVRLTQEGDELFRSAAPMQATFRSFQQDFRERLNTRSSLIKISASEGFARHWLVPRVARLQGQIPGLRMQIDASLQQKSLANGDLDFVIRLGDPGEGDLVGRRVGELAFGFFASSNYLKGRSTPTRLGDLEAHQTLGDTGGVAGFKFLRGDHEVQQLRMREVIAANALVNLHPFTALHAAVAADLGVGLLAAPFAEAEGLVRVIPDESFAVDIWLLRRRESDLRRLTREVGRFLEREINASQAWLAGEQSNAASGEA